MISPQRLTSSILMIALTVLAVMVDWIFILVICSLTVGGLYEFFYLIKKKEIPIYSYTGIFIGLLIPISIYTRFELTKNWELLLIVAGFLLILMLQFAREDNRNAIVGLSTTMFGVLYVSWFLSFLIKIRMMLPGIEGIKLLAFILLVTKGGDTGALIFGSWLGKRPLLPRVSPNKSVEGYLGGLLVSAGIAIACQSFLPNIPHFSEPYVAFIHKVFGVQPVWLKDVCLVFHVFLMGVFFGSLGQLGDLSESLIKRDCNVKDSGKLLPGMGGVLDVIDSLLFSAPAFYLYMNSALSF